MSALDKIAWLAGFVFAVIGWGRVWQHRDSMPRLVSGIFIVAVGTFAMWVAR